MAKRTDPSPRRATEAEYLAGELAAILARGILRMLNKSLASPKFQAKPSPDTEPQKARKAPGLSLETWGKTRLTMTLRFGSGVR